MYYIYIYYIYIYIYIHIYIYIYVVKQEYSMNTEQYNGIIPDIGINNSFLIRTLSFMCYIHRMIIIKSCYLFQDLVLYIYIYIYIKMI